VVSHAVSTDLSFVSLIISPLYHGTKGKSRLVHEFAKGYPDAIFVATKYDLAGHNEPYVALAGAVGNVCQQVSGSKVLQTAAATTIRKEILASDIQLLSAIVPELSLFVGTVKPASLTKHHIRRDGISSNLQLKIVLLFRKLLFILSSNTVVIL
jgi:hypothetical protein